MTTGTISTGTAYTPTIPVRRPTLAPMVAFVGTSLALASFYLAAGAPTPLFVLLEKQWAFPPTLLTFAFAAYSLGLLAALLVVGGLSDHIGRRPVLIAALALEIVAMLMFVVAPDIGWVIAARIVQGIATGSATAAFTAAVIELAPARYKKLGSIIGASAAAGGLGVGALLSGIAVQFSAAPTALIFTSLTVIMVLGLLVAIFSTETVTPRDGALASLVPRVKVPRSARGDFVRMIPGLVGSWMLAALFLGLVPSIIRDVFGIDSGLLNGAAAFVEPGAAAIAGFVLGAVTARRTLIIGNAGVLVGAIIIVTGVAITVLPLVFVGGVIGGVGFGAVLSGSLRALGSLVESHDRGGVFAALFVVTYLSFGIPVIVAGQLIAPVGLLGIALAFVAAISLVSALALVVQVFSGRLRPSTPEE